ncbi:MAG TPA: transporter [Verrucomicrobiae bacterium]|nr:transporter [Verrucomicrobiae bacterium]
MRRAILLTALTMPLSCVLAQEPTNNAILPEELAIARSVVIQDADELESTFTFQYAKAQPREAYTADAEFEYGLTDRWEIDADVPYEFLRPKNETGADGIGDVEAAVRYGVIPVGKEPVALTAGLGLRIPTGDRTRDLGEGRLTLEPFFTASTWLGPCNVQFNGGWARAVTNSGKDPKNDFEYNAAVLYPLKRWYVGVEGDGESDSDTTTYYVTPELIWRPMKPLELLVATPLGITRESADYGVVAIVSLELENLTHRGTDND